MRRLGDELAAARHRITQLEREARRRQAEGQALSPERHAQALAALESRLRAEHEEAMAAIVAEWKARSDRLRRGNADAIVALRREHQDQLDALEAARQQGAGRPRASASEKVVPRKAVTGDRSG
jgi:putative heme iron utilization protein